MYKTYDIITDGPEGVSGGLWRSQGSRGDFTASFMPGNRCGFSLHPDESPTLQPLQINYKVIMQGCIVYSKVYGMLYGVVLVNSYL